MHVPITLSHLFPLNMQTILVINERDIGGVNVIRRPEAQKTLVHREKNTIFFCRTKQHNSDF